MYFKSKDGASKMNRNKTTTTNSSTRWGIFTMKTCSISAASPTPLEL